MATLKEPFALDRSFNTTEDTPRSIADVLAEELARITGRNASQVEYDNTESGLTADNVQDALDEINGKIPTVPSVDIQTAVDEFETYNGGLLSSLKVALSPIQDLHGYDSPWVGGANENKADFVDGYSISPSGEVVEFVGRCATVDPITIEANTTYYVKRFNTVDSGKFIYAVYNGSTLVRRVANIDNNSALDTSGGDKLYVCAYDGTIAELLPMVTKNTLPTAYSPYSNICPISGHTQVDVDVSDGDTTQEQVTVNLGGTYYSGTLDVVTGVFVPDTAVKEYDGSADENWSGNASWNNHSFVFPNTLSDAVAVSGYDTVANIECNLGIAEKPSSIVTTILSQMRHGIGQGEGSSLYANISDDLDTVAKFKTFLSTTPLQVRYYLANPTPIQLSPTMVKALVGENHLSAPLDGQEITESKYRELFTWDEVEAYVNAHSGSGMNYSTEEQVVGTWFGKTLYQKTVDQTIGSDADYTVFANGIDHAHLVNSSFEYSSGRWMSFDYISLGATSNSRTCYVDVQNGALNLHNQSNSSIHWIATIQYTKTSD